MILKIICLTLAIAILGCKTKKQTTTTVAENSSNIVSEKTDISKVLTEGKVSLIINGNKCATIVIENKQDGGVINLIPKDGLSPEFNKEGTILLFYYRPLKIKNPEGCNVGMPVELSNIKKK